VPISLFRTYNGKRDELKIQLWLLLHVPVPDNSASQSYLSSCDAQCLSSLFLNEFTEGAVTTEKGQVKSSQVVFVNIRIQTKYKQ